MRTIGWAAPSVLAAVFLVSCASTRQEQEIRPGAEMTVDLGVSNDAGSAGRVTLTLCWVPAGQFTMGSPDREAERVAREGPQHRVTISRGFWMGKHEVTQRQYRQLMGANPSCFKDAGPDAPVENVDWNMAKAFCERLQARLAAAAAGGAEGWARRPACRLPTEAEWEYACRAGTTTPFHFGNEMDSTMANFDGTYPYGSGREAENRRTTVTVGSFRPNAWGLHDLHGNVGEWCWDGMRSYTSAAQRDPDGAVPCRVVRGGHWLNSAGRCRAAYRDEEANGNRYGHLGFRVLVR